MKNYRIIAVLIAVVLGILGLSFVPVIASWFKKPVECVFKPLESRNSVVSDSVSVTLAGELGGSLALLKQSPSPVSVKALKSYRINFERLSTTYKSLSYDPLLAQKYNAFVSFVCSLIETYNNEKDPEKKKVTEQQINKLISEYIDIFFNYAKERDFESIKQSYDDKITEFFKRKIAMSKEDKYEKDFWERMSKLVPSKLVECPEDDELVSCLELQWIDIKRLTYNDESN